MSLPEAARERVAALADRPRSGWFSGVATRVMSAVVRTALPPVCAGCGVSGHWMCAACDEVTRRVALDDVCRRCGRLLAVGHVCDRCLTWGDALSACRSAFLFDGAVRQTIHRLKYGGEYARAEWCGVEIARLVVQLNWRPDLVIPVPLHRSRLRRRGYNQSAQIAAIAARTLSYPWGNVLLRTRATVSQVGLDAVQRRENVVGAFGCPHELTDLAILLVDDVVTTGATLEACAEACRRAGARDVRAVTVATGS